MEGKGRWQMGYSTPPQLGCETRPEGQSQGQGTEMGEEITEEGNLDYRRKFFLLDSTTCSKSVLKALPLPLASV